MHADAAVVAFQVRVVVAVVTRRGGAVGVVLATRRFGVAGAVSRITTLRRRGFEIVIWSVVVYHFDGKCTGTLHAMSGRSGRGKVFFVVSATASRLSTKIVMASHELLYRVVGIVIASGFDHAHGVGLRSRRSGKGRFCGGEVSVEASGLWFMR